MKISIKKFLALLLSLLPALLTPCASAISLESTVGQYGMLPVYGFDIADGAYAVTVESDCALLQDVLADITVTDGTITAELMPDNADLSALSMESSETAAENAIEANSDGVFTIPVKALDTEIPLSVYDTQKQQWQNCTILFRADSLPQEALLIDLPDYDLIEKALDRYEEQSSKANDIASPIEAVSVDMADGEYAVSVELTGGSGKASVSTPTLMLVRDGKAYARLEWSSSNYDYMIVGTETYYNTSAEGSNSVFEIPIGCWDSKMTVIADTTAMGTPHEVQYTLTFYQSSIGGKGQLPQEASKRVVFVAMLIIIGGGILNYYVKKKRSI
ncbi:MAG: hypothetical protein Q4P20_05935 [Eubacteriales bacterium]|nr:hypothetical protein [Eubacteriales bacterium]